MTPGWEEPANTLEGRAATQRDLNMLQEWANRHLMKCHKDKCKVLITGRKKPWQQHRLGTYWLESSSVEKDLGIAVQSKASMSQQCTMTEKVSSILHCTNRSTARRQKEEIMPLYSALTRPHLEYCIQFLVSPNTGKTLIHWSELSEGPPRCSGDWGMWRFTRPDGIKS